MILLQHLDVNGVSMDFQLRKVGIAKETAMELHHLMDVIVAALEEDAGAKVEWLDVSSSLLTEKDISFEVLNILTEFGENLAEGRVR